MTKMEIIPDQKFGTKGARISGLLHDLKKGCKFESI